MESKTELQKKSLRNEGLMQKKNQKHNPVIYLVDWLL